MSPRSSDSRDRIEVGAFFGLVAGVVAFAVIFVWILLTRPGTGATPLRPILLLHAGHVLLYTLAGALVGFLWPARRTAAGHWGLWLLATATGAVSVNSVSYGPIWTWASPEWGRYALMAVLFTPVFAWPRRRSGAG
jgi:hypothetical protein